MSTQSPPQSSFQPAISWPWDVPRLYKDKIYRENTRPVTAGGALSRSTRPAIEGSTRVPMHAHRSKSSTAIPTPKNFGLRLSPTSSVDKSTSRYSLDARSISGSLHSQAERPESLAQSLRAKGSRLMRRQNSKFNLRTLEWVESSDHSWSRGNGGQDRINPADNNPAWRPDISEPYNFQHLTHTHARHFQQIDRASHHDLVNEFSAIRASQAPRRELQGIKAEFLQSRLLRSEPTSPARRSLISPPSLSPIRSTFDSPARSPNHHYAQSADYFSQRSASKQIRDRAATSPVSPPARYIPGAAAPDLFTQYQEAPTTEDPVRGLSTHDYSAYDFSDSRCVAAHPSSEGASSGFVDYAALPHAVTTPDNSAMTLRPSSIRPTGAELADVPEEDEQGTTMSSRPSTAGSGLRHAKSFPSIRSRSNSQPWSRSPSKSYARDSNPMSEGRLSQSEIMLPLVGDEPDDVPIRPRFSRQQSLKAQGFDACWEDDIDYCYEHAAEADCDFDWDRISSKDAEGATVKAPSTGTIDSISEGYENVHQAPSPEEPPANLLPRIQTSIPVPSLCSANSAKSSSLSSLNGPVTPSFPLPSPQTYALSPHVIAPKEITMVLQDEAFENIFFNKAYSSENLPLQAHRFEPPADISQENSPRSSRSPISKSNSQESFLISRSSSFRYPRSTDSMSSVPDLVHSKSSRDGLNISAEQAAELAATLKASESLWDFQHTPLKPKISQNLVKEAAWQSMVQKAASFGSLEEEEHIDDEVVVLPSLSHHERSLSAATEQKPTQALPQRKRSVSSATATGMKNSFSYSLFPSPTTAVRSP